MSTFRKIGPADNLAVAAVIRSVMTEFGAVGPGFSIMDPEVDDMYASYSAAGAAFYVLEEGLRVLGCGGVAHLAGADQDVCELRKMYFLPEARGRGLGIQLMQLLLRDASDMGYRFMYLETLHHMEQANRLYQRAGFVLLDGPMGQTGHHGCNQFYLKNLG